MALFLIIICLAPLLITYWRNLFYVSCCQGILDEGGYKLYPSRDKKRGQALYLSLFAWSPLHSVCHQLFPTKRGWQFDPTLLLTQRLQPHPFL